MSNKKATSWTSILIKALIAVTIILANFGIALAADDPPKPPTDAEIADQEKTDAENKEGRSNARKEYSSFDVGKYLTVDSDKSSYIEGKQDQAYLNTENPVGAFILQAINLIALTAASLSFLAIVIAGFLMISAAGNETQLNKAKEVLQRAIIGLVITLSAYFIISFVQNLLFETTT
jgi:Kef-type K+ transport system membrane component KefB